MAALSILDLAPVNAGETAADALRKTIDLARHAEGLGYTRYWVAEHHNMTGIASAATAVVVGAIAANTKTLRVGSGGIMLPNHAPLVIAEQFGTLESLYPGRIDLGLGRAPGTDQLTVRALRRTGMEANEFPNDVLELQALLGPVQEGQRIQAVPGADTHVPLWILGSSLYGSQVAAEFGLPYAFASHFAPDALMDALSVYRARFKPSQQLQTSYAAVGCNVICANTQAEAERLFTSLQMRFANMARGKRGKLEPPIDDIETYWSPAEKRQAQSMLACSFVGTPQTVASELAQFIKQTGADELIVAAAIFDHEARKRSYTLLKEAMAG
ncbi:MAG: LLM class flavin-dependent oxidoreductase [Beijerinckiaceae bacterium]